MFKFGKIAGLLFVLVSGCDTHQGTSGNDAGVASQASTSAQKPPVVVKTPTIQKPTCDLNDLIMRNPGEAKLLRAEIAASESRYLDLAALLDTEQVVAERMKMSTPKELPPLVPRTFGFNRLAGGKLVASMWDTCELAVVADEKRMDKTYDGSWAELIAFTAHRFVALGDHADSTVFYDDTSVTPDERAKGRYEAIVHIMTGGNFVGTWGDTEVMEAIRKRVLPVVEDEAGLRSLGRWTMPFVLDLLPEGQRRRAVEWLKDFWAGSHMDFAALEKRVKHGDENEEYGPGGIRNEDFHLLRNKKMKIEGFYLRRWKNAGRGRSGDDRIAMYRFWMVRVAKELKVPEATAWATEVRTDLAKTTTLKFKDWYLDQLNGA